MIKDVYYASFERDKRDLFDNTHPSYFNKSKRIRIVDFILKRKRFSDDSDDDFAFGINKLLQLKVYSDAYPLHDGDLDEKGIIVFYSTFKFKYN